MSASPAASTRARGCGPAARHCRASDRRGSPRRESRVGSCCRAFALPAATSAAAATPAPARGDRPHGRAAASLASCDRPSFHHGGGTAAAASMPRDSAAPGRAMAPGAAGRRRQPDRAAVAWPPVHTPCRAVSAASIWRRFALWIRQSQRPGREHHQGGTARSRPRAPVARRRSRRGVAGDQHGLAENHLAQQPVEEIAASLLRPQAWRAALVDAERARHASPAAGRSACLPASRW